MLMQHKAFPTGTKIDKALNFYFMLNSLEADADRLSIIAATLANNGICPLTGDAVLSQRIVRDVLSTMFCCGMNDYSGKFAFEIGLPAKSGVGGGTMVVVPGVMGFCTYSPRLDEHSNSVRGTLFSKMFSNRFGLHRFMISNDPMLDSQSKNSMKNS